MIVAICFVNKKPIDIALQKKKINQTNNLNIASVMHSYNECTPSILLIFHQVVQ
jgi:hypothetical protein